MKTKLPLLILFLSLIGYSQTDIEQFHSATGSQYVVVTGAIDQSLTGASASWDFTGLTTTSTLLTDAYIDTPPTSIIRTSEGGTLVSEIGLNTTGGELSVTSALSSGVQLNYSDFAKIGAFPLSYGYSNTDGVEGTFSGDVSGTILNSSSINVNVDAWGNLKVGTFDGEVTRLKIVQNLNLMVSIVTITGTQTSYFYYANSNDLVFRTTRLEVPFGNIDETTMEVLSSYTLSSKKYQIAESDIKLQTNPVKDVLMLHSSNGIQIKSITISDVSGRIVLNSNTNKTTLNVSYLKSGLFFASIVTNRGIVTKKFIKL